jgi:hypothetical protein
MPYRKIPILFGCSLLVMALAPARSRGETAVSNGGKLYVGWASVNITPDRPVALAGQLYTRISKFVHDPVTATALALETRQGDTRGGAALMISADLVAISREEILEPLRARLRERLTDLDPQQVLLNATHTHTAPVAGGLPPYELPKEGFMQPAEYEQFLLGKLAEAAVSAWQARKPARVGCGLGYAVVGHNRRAVYADGRAEMYGQTDRSDFRGFEGEEDHTVKTLFFWTPERKLTGVVVLVPCPSQVVESESYISADFWADVRAELRKRHGKDLFIYPMTGASGDQSPHLLYRRRAEDLILRRRSLTETQEIGRRVANAVDDALEDAVTEQHSEVPLLHQAGILPLPRRVITKADWVTAQKEHEQALGGVRDADRHMLLVRAQGVMDRYVAQATDPVYRAEVHAIRLGDVAIVTNPFELFLDYGMRMEAQSPAVLTMVVQLTCGYGKYLPTAAAIRNGSYSAKPADNEVGPDGGDILVDHTVEMIHSMWPAAKKSAGPFDTPDPHN